METWRHGDINMSGHVIRVMDETLHSLLSTSVPDIYQIDPRITRLIRSTKCRFYIHDAAIIVSKIIPHLDKLPPGIRQYINICNVQRETDEGRGIACSILMTDVSLISHPSSHTL